VACIIADTGLVVLTITMVPLATSTMAIVFVGIPLVVVWVIGVVDIVRRDLSLQAKAAWITVVLLFPFVGVLAYFVMRKPTKDEVQRHRAAAAAAPRGGAGSGMRPQPPVD
jgi:hypothetical protein